MNKRKHTSALFQRPYVPRYFSIAFPLTSTQSHRESRTKLSCESVEKEQEDAECDVNVITFILRSSFFKGKREKLFFCILVFHHCYFREKRNNEREIFQQITGTRIITTDCFMRTAVVLLTERRDL